VGVKEDDLWNESDRKVEIFVEATFPLQAKKASVFLTHPISQLVRGMPISDGGIAFIPEWMIG
jgi:hypothetical protein